MRVAHRVLLVSLILLGWWGGPWQRPAQGLTTADVHRITFAAQRGFEHIVQLWKDKRFAALYQFGTFASQVDLSPEAFEHYMNHALRSLQCCWETLQDVSTSLAAPDRVYVRGRLGFNNREFLVVRGRNRFIARGFMKEETLTFLLQLEDDAWRIDLFRILALSGIPLEIPGVPFFLGRPY